MVNAARRSADDVVLAGRAAVEGRNRVAMDSERFDDLVKRITAARLTRLEVLRGVLASAAVGLMGATLSAEAMVAQKQAKGAGKKTGKGKGKGQGKGKGKVTLCHKRGTPAEKTLAVPPSAVAAHLGHGTPWGPAPPWAPRRVPAPAARVMATQIVPPPAGVAPLASVSRRTPVRVGRAVGVRDRAPVKAPSATVPPRRTASVKRRPSPGTLIPTI